MPKEKQTRSISLERRSRGSPYPSSSSTKPCHQRSSLDPPVRPTSRETDEWDQVLCPVCMESPHNAVLLHCSSYEKGCRPFMCDTSYRHSNCLDQYRKAFSCSSEGSETCQHVSKLTCPLCRGPVSGWTVNEPARRYMNFKSRSCSVENCDFAGAYRELRSHARKEHPAVRPSEVDPDRQRDWRRMEQQRDLGDLFSMLSSGFTGEEEEEMEREEGEEEEERERELFGPAGGDDNNNNNNSSNGNDNGNDTGRVYADRVTVILVVQSGGTRSYMRYTRSSISAGRRGRGIILWGEHYSADGTPDGNNSENATGQNGDADVTESHESDAAGLLHSGSGGEGSGHGQSAVHDSNGEHMPDGNGEHMLDSNGEEDEVSDDR